MNETTKGFDFLAGCFDRHADRPCLLLEGGTWSYAHLWDTAARYGSRLGELGVRTGDKILVRLENSEHVLALYLACMANGYVACPIDPATPEARVKATIARLAPRYVCDASNLADWTRARSGGPGSRPRPEPNASFLVITSSGTTGSPKDIVLGADAMVESARSFASLAGHDADTTVYHHLPMYYMAGIFNQLFCPLVTGSRIVVGPRFSGPQMMRFWELPRRHGVNHLTLTPTMAHSLARIFRADDDVLEHVRRYQGIISTGSMLHSSVADHFQRVFGVPLRSCYGVTEAGGSITLQSWDQALARGSVGGFRPDVSIVAGSDEKEPHEILVRTPFMMKGYLEAGTGVTSLRSGLDEAGYFHTGDRGFLQGGSLWVTGREHDLVKKGGEFVALPVIEDLALGHSAVAEAAAVAVPDDYWGNKVVLFYVPRAAQDIERIEDDLRTVFAEQLRKIEIPDKLIPIPTIPKTAVGKSMKSKLIAMYTI